LSMGAIFKIGRYACEFSWDWRALGIIDLEVFWTWSLVQLS
jgi:hypothetical protein